MKPLNREIDELIQHGISKKVFPGAVAYIVKDSASPYCEAFGFRMLTPETKPMQPDTIFDLASLTKPIVTATLIMRCVEEADVKLDDPVQNYLPQFSHPQVTISHLLTHTSGLPAWRATYLESENRAEVVNYLCQIPLDYPTGTQVVYSCLGYILLGKMLERLTGEPLDAIAQKRIFQPLDMNRTRYNPPAVWADRCAATEDSNSFEKRMVDYRPHDWREGVIVGEVHDENAHFLGGVSGNAGLFSTAKDIAKILPNVSQRRGGCADTSKHQPNGNRSDKRIRPATQLWLDYIGRWVTLPYRIYRELRSVSIYKRRCLLSC